MFMNVILRLLYFPGRMCGRAMSKRLSRCMPEPVIAAAAENGKKRGRLTFDWLADVPKLTLRTVKKEAGSH